MRVARATGLASVKRWFHGLGSASLEAVSSPVGTRAGADLIFKKTETESETGAPSIDPS